MSAGDRARGADMMRVRIIDVDVDGSAGPIARARDLGRGKGVITIDLRIGVGDQMIVPVPGQEWWISRRFGTWALDAIMSGAVAPATEVFRWLTYTSTTDADTGTTGSQVILPFPCYFREAIWYVEDQTASGDDTVFDLLFSRLLGDGLDFSGGNVSPFAGFGIMAAGTTETVRYMPTPGWLETFDADLFPADLIPARTRLHAFCSEKAADLEFPYRVQVLFQVAAESETTLYDALEDEDGELTIP